MTRRGMTMAGALLLTFAAGCGGDDGGTAASTTPSETAAGQVHTVPGAAVATTTPSAPQVPAGALQAVDDAFRPTHLTVGRRRLLSVVSTGHHAHTVTIAALGIDVPLAAGATVALPLPGRPGTYELVCKLHQGMTAQVTIRR